MIKIYKLLIITLFIFGFSSAEAQYYQTTSDSKSWRDKVFFGGRLGLQFGDLTAIDVSPMVGYRIKPIWHVGLGLSYGYNYYRSAAVSNSTYSVRAFQRFFIFENLFAHTEIETLNSKVFTSFNPVESYRKWINSYLVGGGYFQKMGAHSGMYLMVLWNLNETKFTPYSNPIIRVGFVF